MYILINLDTLKVHHKNESINALCEVAEIECRDECTLVTNCDNGAYLKQFTHMELRMMYKNITGQDIPDSVASRFLTAVLWKQIDLIPTSTINEVEAERQALYCEGKEGLFKYCQGAFRPAKVDELFSQVSEHSDDIIRQATKGEFNKDLKAPVRRTATKPVPTQATAVKNGPTRGTAKIIIWAVADSMWEAVGKPIDKAEVLKLRKEIMNKLESDEGVKRTSSSSELGKWHKERAPF